MLELEHILKVLKKYGFYSLNRAPFIYQNDNKCGVYFVWPTLHYGNLERVLFFDTLEALEEEVFKYYWFMNNKNNYDLEVVFDNYETLSPQVTYKYNGIDLTISSMKNFMSEQSLMINDRERVKIAQLKRPADILLMILEETFKKQNQIYSNVLELFELFSNLTKEFNDKKNKLELSVEEKENACEILEDEVVTLEESFGLLKKELDYYQDEKNLNEFIVKILKLLNEVDLNEYHLQNCYLLEYYPLEIEKLKNKINLLDGKLYAKGKKNKTNLNDEKQFNNKEMNLSSLDEFMSTKRRLIQEKYIRCYQLENKDIGDFIVAQESMELNLPDQIFDEQVKFIDKTILIEEMQKKYEELPAMKKTACHVATSFLNDCLNILSEINNINELGIKDILKILEDNKTIKKFDNAFKCLDNYYNTNIRLKYLNLINVDSLEDFVISLVKTLYVLSEINMSINEAFSGYYDDKDKEIIIINLKQFGIPLKRKSFITNVMPNTLINYSPIQIVNPVDIVENRELEVKQNHMIFLLKEKVGFETSHESKKIVLYEKDKIINKQNYVIITNMREVNHCKYYEDKVFSFESEGI